MRKGSLNKLEEAFNKRNQEIKVAAGKKGGYRKQIVNAAFIQLKFKAVDVKCRFFC